MGGVTRRSGPVGTGRARTRSRVITGAAVLAALGIVGLTAFISAEELSSVKDLDDIAGPVQVTGQLPPLGPDGVDSLPAGQSEAPSATALTMSGEPVTLGPGAASGQVLVFLAHWCPVCQQEVPQLVAHLAEYGVPAGAEVVAVMTGLDPGRPNWPPDEWLEREGLDVTIIRDDADGTLMRAYGLTAYPSWVAVGPDGKVAARRTGILTSEEMQELLEAAAG